MEDAIRMDPKSIVVVGETEFLKNILRFRSCASACSWTDMYFHVVPEFYNFADNTYMCRISA